MLQRNINKVMILLVVRNYSFFKGVKTMFEAFNTKQLLSFSKQLSDTAFKAHHLTVASMERAVDMQMKHFESRVNATVDFLSSASEARDQESFKNLFPQTVALVKDSAEKAYAASQELMGLSVKTTEAINELVKGSVEMANDAVVNPAQARKPAKAAR